MWTKGTIAELCEIEYGTRVVRKNEHGNDYPVYGGGGETFRIDRKNRTNRLIVARFGMSEKCTRFVSGDFFLNDSGLTISPKRSDLSQDYLDKVILAKNNEIFTLGRGSAQKNLNMDGFKNICFQFPSLAEQQRIVAKLDAAFAEIDGAIEGLKSKENETEKLKAALLNASLNYETLIWNDVKLGEVVSYEKINGQGSDLPYVGMEHISKDTMELVGSLEIPEKTSNTFKFDNRHVLFGRLRPYLRKVLVPDFEGQCSTEIFCILPSDKVDKRFLAYWLLHPKVSKKINETSTGARMPRANMNAILDFNFPLLTIEEQQRIVTMVDAVFSKIEYVNQAILNSKINYLSLKSAILAKELQSEAA